MEQTTRAPSRSGDRLGAASPHDDWRVRSTGHVVEAGAIRRMADAIDDPNPLWRSSEAARAAGFADVVAPPTFVDSMNPFYAGEPYPVWDDLPYAFSAGDEFVFRAPLCAGDVIDVECRIARVEEKRRRDGSDRLRLVTYEKAYRRGDEPVAEELWTCVLFGGERASTAPASRQRPEWAVVDLGEEERHVDPMTIVKWAAAVGDFERIHYDHKYATEEQHLPAVVGHGPYSAAMLLKRVTDRLDDVRRLRRASFRYRQPVYAGERITFAGWASEAPDGPRAGRAQLVAGKEDGSVATTGTCEWGPGEAR